MQTEATSALAHGLTRRELQVLQLAAHGKTNAEIAAELWISQETVKTHICKALWQLNAASRTEAVAIALRAGAIA
jgi:two-component system, NarL family, nitrate/nitrite response regulator NarL